MFKFMQNNAKPKTTPAQKQAAQNLKKITAAAAKCTAIAAKA